MFSQVAAYRERYQKYRRDRTYDAYYRFHTLPPFPRSRTGEGEQRNARPYFRDQVRAVLSRTAVSFGFSRKARGRRVFLRFRVNLSAPIRSRTLQC